MTYTKKQFLEDVKKEAVALKKHATKEELSNLNFDELRPASFNSCIYGQLCGNCNSERAVDLIEECCPRFFHNPIDDLSGNEVNVQKVLSKKVNGEKVRGFRKHRYKAGDDFFAPFKYVSAIETYIASPIAKNKNLIDFLKGNRKDLVL